MADEGESESEDDDLKPRGNGQQQEELLGRAGHGEHQGLDCADSSCHGTVGRATGTECAVPGDVVIPVSAELRALFV